MTQTIGRHPRGLSKKVRIYRTEKDNRREQCLQIDCASYLLNDYPGLLFWHTRQEGKASKKWQELGSKSGVKKGVPDLIILDGRVGFFEIKTKSTPSPEQKTFLNHTSELDHFSCVVYSLNDFKRAVLDFLENR